MSPWPLHFKHSHWWKNAEPVQVRFTLHLRDQQSMWIQDGCNVHMDFYMSSNGSCFMVTWIIFKNHLLEVDTNQEDHGTPKTHNHSFILFDHAWIEIHRNSIWLRVRSHLTFTLHLRIRDQHYMILEVCWDGLGTLFFWALTISWSRLLARVWSGP